MLGQSPASTVVKGSDAKALEQTTLVTSMLLWVPHALALFYLALGATFQIQLLLLVESVATVALTVYVAKRLDGEWLMLVAWLLGILGELAGFGITEDPEWSLSRNIWILVSIFHGVLGAILCKTKDIQDGRYYAHYSLSERLYIVVPFTMGQWMGFIVTNGWSGIFKTFSSIFLCLSTVGYGVVAHRIMAHFGIFKGDVIGMIGKLFTTSFGVVFAGLSVSIAFAFYLAIPFIHSLLMLNAVVSSVGIVSEILLYDVV